MYLLVNEEPDDLHKHEANLSGQTHFLGLTSVSLAFSILTEIRSAWGLGLYFEG